GRLDVGGERPAPLFEGEILRAVDRVLESRVVHEDVEATEFVNGPANDLPPVVLVTDVSRDPQVASAGGLDQFTGPLRVVVLIEVTHSDVGALLGEGDAHRTPDAA